MNNHESAVEIAARYLESQAEPLVSAWIDWVRGRVQSTPVSALPERALRDHIPPVLEALARFLREPVELARQDLLGHLRLHGQVRSDQGYTLPEVLAEFDGLADLVTRGVRRAIEQRSEACGVTDTLEASTRLAAGLRAVSYIAMGTFNRSDEQRRRSIASELEEFARAVSHELRNPLNTLSLCLQILREQELERDQLIHQVGVMESAVERSLALLETVRTLAIAESARKETRLVPLVEAVQNVLKELGTLAAAGGVEVTVADPLPEVSLEGVLAYIVLANVVGNALKYRDPAKDERWVKIGASFLEEELDSGFCELVVADNGIGIPEEYLPRVCQKGFRAHPEQGQGTGLGLHIVQEAVTSRGGRLEVESAEGRGTTVTLRIRCLASVGSELTAERFRVDHLMGETIWNEVSEGSRPELPPEPS